MKGLITGLTLVGFSFTAFSAMAAKPDISWNYLSAGYAKANIKLADSARFKPDGFQLAGSYLLTDDIYVRASYFDVSGTYSGTNADASELTLSLGMRDDISDNVDSFFEAGYARSKANGNNPEADSDGNKASNGFHAGAGFRYRLTPELELAIAARYSDTGDDGSAYGDLSARYRITPMFDLYANYLFESDVSVLGAGVVFNF